ncbi:MAG: hypothetical protein WC716_06820 [Chitinophagaceae bacterium]|jgi:hypothetical protein
MYDTRLSYLIKIDDFSKLLATEYISGERITERILTTIVTLYECAKVERYFEDAHFETAYHSPITGELEFFIARILFHYSTLKNKEWKVYLRRQENRTAPDIRLSKNEKTFAIIEVKAKAGWIQQFLSPVRFQVDLEKYNSGASIFNPNDLINTSKNQLHKYSENFGIETDCIFFLLPTLKLVHRKKYSTSLAQYYEYFASTSGLPRENFILLSNNVNLDLSGRDRDFNPTENFENLISQLDKLEDQLP